jgi:hypothetical protein
MLLQEITIMDRAVYDMGAQAGAQWLQERIADGKIADLHELLEQAPDTRARSADKIAGEFGALAMAGGMVWNNYKRDSYAAGWLAGLYAAIVEAIPSARLLDVLLTFGAPL